MQFGRKQLRFALALAVASCAIFSAAALRAQEARSDAAQFPEQHAEQRSGESPDKQASDLTESVTRNLPRAASIGAPITRRNLIDRHLFGAMERDGIPHAALANDYEFVRRIYLDMTGRIPTRDQLSAFINDDSPDKRDRGPSTEPSSSMAIKAGNRSQI